LRAFVILTFFCLEKEVRGNEEDANDVRWGTAKINDGDANIKSMGYLSEKIQIFFIDELSDTDNRVDEEYLEPDFYIDKPVLIENFFNIYASHHLYSFPTQMEKLKALR